MNTNAQQGVLLIGRLLMSIIFLVTGYSKIGGYAGTQAYMESMGVPGMLLPLVIVLEIGGGLALLAGVFTRTVAFLLAGFCVVSGFIFHFEPANQMQNIMLMKNLAMAGGLFYMMAYGAGNWAVHKTGHSS